MGRVVSEILQKVDSLAVECCTLMTLGEREEYLAYRKKRLNSGQMYKTKYSSEETYHKGKKAGQEREIFNVEQQGFLKLWKEIEAYVVKASSKSNFYAIREDIEDDVSEVKFLLLRVLRYFGPRPSGQNLSAIIKLIVNNVLTNSFKAKVRSIEYRAVPKFEAFDASGETLSNAAEVEDISRRRDRAISLGKSKAFVNIYPRVCSIYKPVSKDGETLALIDTLKDLSFPTTAVEDTVEEFLQNIPSKFVSVFEQLLAGKAMFVACRGSEFSSVGECREAIKQNDVLSWNYSV